MKKWLVVFVALFVVVAIVAVIAAMRMAEILYVPIGEVETTGFWTVEDFPKATTEFLQEAVIFQRAHNEFHRHDRNERAWGSGVRNGVPFEWYIFKDRTGGAMLLISEPFDKYWEKDIRAAEETMEPQPFCTIAGGGVDKWLYIQVPHGVPVDKFLAALGNVGIHTSKKSK